MSPATSSRRRPRRSVSYTTIQRKFETIASRHFSAAFNEMFYYAAGVNPNGHSFVRQYIRAMRKQLERDEASQHRPVIVLPPTVSLTRRRRPSPRAAA